MLKRLLTIVKRTRINKRPRGRVKRYWTIQTLKLELYKREKQFEPPLKTFETQCTIFLSYPALFTRKTSSSNQIKKLDRISLSTSSFSFSYTTIIQCQLHSSRQLQSLIYHYKNHQKQTQLFDYFNWIFFLIYKRQTIIIPVFWPQD